MSHTPYGYIIRNGKAVIDEKAAAQIRDLFQAYLSGLSLIDVAKKVGINRYHPSIAKMLTNNRYIGNDYYPQIVKEDIFHQVESEKLRRAQMLGRIHEPKVQKPIIRKIRFSAPTPKQNFDDPVQQAEYVYSLIESEVIADGE